MSNRTRFLCGLGVVVLTALFKKVLPERHNYEEPNYTVLRTHADFEIREYGPRLEARTVVTGTESEAISEGFRTLAEYIFGGNRANQQVAMTTPVTYSTQGRQTVSFVMPSQHSRQTLPEPTSRRVELVDVPSQVVAVRRFSGWSAQTRWHEERKSLLRELASRNIEVAGSPVLAQYDPPWTLGFLRRNEVLVKVQNTVWR